jgi:predicted O-methyltransferase YrrM
MSLFDSAKNSHLEFQMSSTSSLEAVGDPPPILPALLASLSILVGGRALFIIQWSLVQSELMRAGTVERLSTLAYVAPLRALETIFRPILRPTLDLFGKVAAIQTTSPDEYVSKVLGVSLDSVRELHFEFENELVPEAVPNSTFPSTWRTTTEEAFVLFAITRVKKPLRVIETGVAEGRSSRAILTALQMNTSGELESFDVRYDVGSSVDPALRDRWKLRTVPWIGKRRILKHELARLSPIDLFFHDSQHTYGWQSIEYRMAWNSLSQGGFLTSDDVDSSFAFLDFCNSVKIAPEVLVGERKVFGVAKKPTAVSV